MTKQEKRTHWAKLIEAQQQSGMTITQFCQQQGIHYQTFYNWAKKLKGDPEPKPVIQPVIITEEPHVLASAVTVTLTSGHQLEFPVDMQPQQITHWLAALQ